MRRIANSIAVLDLDGPGQIIDTTARAEEADRRVQAHFAAKNEPTPAQESNEYKSIFYDAFWDESLLALDQLNPGAIQAIARLRQSYSDVYVLTSRPEFIARQTQLWLKEHGIKLEEEEIRFKLYQHGEDKREQFTSTPSWKSTIVYQAAWAYWQVLFVDDDERNRRAVNALRMCNITIKESLKDFAFDDSPIIV